MNNLKACSIALKEFKKKYPSVTSADLQTFILGYQAAEETKDKDIKLALLACLMFSGANSNQGLSKISGISFGEQVETILSAVESNTDDQSVISVIAKLTH